MKAITLVICCFLAAACIQAQYIYVPANYPTIQEAINAALPGDVIVVDDGVYYERLNFLGKKPLTVTSQFYFDGDESHIENTILDGSLLPFEKNASVVYFILGEDTTSVLNGFTIRNGRGTLTEDGEFTTRSGGAIFISESGAKITNNRIINNTLGYNPLQNDIDVFCGAGIAMEAIENEEWVIIENNIISNNKCISGKEQAYGAGIAVCSNCRMAFNTITNNLCQGKLTSSAVGTGFTCFTYEEWEAEVVVDIHDNIIANNIAQSDHSYASTAGGFVQHMGVSFRNNDVMDNTTISGNTSGGVGGLGLWIPMGDIFISGNTFTRNSSNTWAGALDIETDAAYANAAAAFIDNNYFLDNHARDAGAILLYSVSACLQNNVFTRNNADERCGAILAWRGFPIDPHYMIRVINNSFYENTAQWGGAIYSAKAKPMVFNCVFEGNAASMGPELYIPYLHDTVEIAYSDVDLALIYGKYIDGGNNINVDPLFDDETMLTLQAGSPCIDMGTEVYCCMCGFLNPCPGYDITGIPRAQGEGPDIGAHELLMTLAQEPPVVAPGTSCIVYPNPAVSTVQFGFEIETPGNAVLLVYDNAGRQVAEIPANYAVSGKKQITWDTGSLPAGVYFYRLTACDKHYGGKLTVIR